MSFRVLGTGMYVPPRVVTNDDLSQFLETNDEWITQRVGVKERHISTNETAADMGAKAARAALENSGVAAEEIDLILAASVSGESISPSVSCMIHLILQKMSKNAREKFGCRGKLPRFSPLAPEAAVREKARSKPLKYSLLRSNKNYAQGGCPAHSLQLRVQKPLTALQNDTVACQGSFCRTRWPPRGSSRCRPCSGCSSAPRRVSRFAG